MRKADKENKERNYYAEERELLHKQLELLAELSKNVNLEAMELAALSEQMIMIYLAINPEPGESTLQLLKKSFSEVLHQQTRHQLELEFPSQAERLYAKKEKPNA